MIITIMIQGLDIPLQSCRVSLCEEIIIHQLNLKLVFGKYRNSISKMPFVGKTM